MGVDVPSGERIGLEELASLHGDALVRFAWMLTGNAPDAEDLVQSVLAKLVDRGVDDLEDPAVYARRAIINLHTSARRRATTYLKVLGRIGTPTHAPDADAAERDAIWRALDVLTERQRAAVVLRYYEDFTDERNAEVLGCRPASARSLVFRALPRLKAELERTASVDEEAGHEA